MRNARIPLADAALRLGQSYWRTRDSLLRGDLTGGRDNRGRFYVESSSVERLLRRRARERPKPQPIPA